MVKKLLFWSSVRPRREGTRKSCSPRASASRDNRQRRHSLPRDVARTQPGLLVQDRALDLNDPDNITSRNRNVEDNRQIEAADEVDMEPVPGPFGDVEQNVAPVPVCSEYSTEYQLFASVFDYEIGQYCCHKELALPPQCGRFLCLLCLRFFMWMSLQGATFGTCHASVPLVVVSSLMRIRIVRLIENAAEFVKGMLFD
ncbi:hypothetical protein TNCT_84862 [Trichonephila clavata]|uniref:Uncharacterized protein n=1 Tax=Trichonephila clavata TaxID=2740835 RepID=A0A8X6L0J3_TRICU|nr:hypothetical protein TNCT_84862 [Trichonephila clavata]